MKTPDKITAAIISLSILSLSILGLERSSQAQEFKQTYDKSVDLREAEKNAGDEKDTQGLLGDSLKEKAAENRTSFDFGNMLIDGKNNAPTGFLITGKKNQTLRRMIKLRSEFKNELKNSAEELPALVK